MQCVHYMHVCGWNMFEAFSRCGYRDLQGSSKFCFNWMLFSAGLGDAIEAMLFAWQFNENPPKVNKHASTRKVTPHYAEPF